MTKSFGLLPYRAGLADGAYDHAWHLSTRESGHTHHHLGSIPLDELERLLSRLNKDDLHSIQIATEDGDISLSIFLGANAKVAVNWHDDSERSSDEDSSCVLIDESMEAVSEVATLAKWNQNACYPAKQFVSIEDAHEAAKDFYVSGKRAARLTWSQDF